LKNFRFHSNGKFLLSGEYLVLKGATSLAVPLKLGQSLEVSELNIPSFKNIVWKAFYRNSLWFEVVFESVDIEIVQTSDALIAEQLRSYLLAANSLNPHILGNLCNHQITTQLDFDVNWGLGSSSTLISNIAQLFQINPFRLYFQVANGSGYDVACASAQTPILYTLKDGNPVIQPVAFNPHFSDNLFFVYLGKKQKSDASIDNFSAKLNDRNQEIALITELSKQMTASRFLDEFEDIIIELEKVTSGILDIPTVKESKFDDFDGAVKSLGAWGGDFVLMTWKESEKALKEYLANKGLTIFFRYNELVLNNNNNPVDKL